MYCFVLFSAFSVCLIVYLFCKERCVGTLLAPPSLTFFSPNRLSDAPDSDTAAERLLFQRGHWWHFRKCNLPLDNSACFLWTWRHTPPAAFLILTRFKFHNTFTALQVFISASLFSVLVLSWFQRTGQKCLYSAIFNWFLYSLIHFKIKVRERIIKLPCCNP